MLAKLKKFMGTPAAVLGTYAVVAAFACFGLATKWHSINPITRWLAVAVFVLTLILYALKAAYLIWSVKRGLGVPKD